jgi:hypothetical protein
MLLAISRVATAPWIGASPEGPPFARNFPCKNKLSAHIVFYCVEFPLRPAVSNGCRLCLPLRETLVPKKIAPGTSRDKAGQAGPILRSWPRSQSVADQLDRPALSASTKGNTQSSGNRMRSSDSYYCCSNLLSPATVPDISPSKRPPREETTTRASFVKLSPTNSLPHSLLAFSHL